MALNKYMHERNIYKQRKPDFQALAVKYDYFREKVTQATSGKMILDFKDPSAMRALTRALLEDDFGLCVELPLDRLIPMVPQRLNYILWLEDILGETSQQVHGIDIGTGASCIFPLLGCRLNRWSFLASELDEQNIFFARKNVEKNKLTEKITIKSVSEDTILRGFVDDDSSTTYDFCMCNPPFYTDHLEAQGITSARSDDRPEPSSVSTASETESIAWGGEVRFVSRMIEESLVLKEKIRVYTSMLGKKMSVSLLKDELAKKKIPKFSTTEFCQGKTMRWGIAWTFDETVMFPKSSFKSQKNVKPPLVYEIPRSTRAVSDYTVQAFTHFIKQHLDQLKIHFYIKHSGKFYTGLMLKATENNWSHQRRKRRQQKRRSNPDDAHTDTDKTCNPYADNDKTDSNITDSDLTDARLAPGDNPDASEQNCDSTKPTNGKSVGNSEKVEMEIDPGGKSDQVESKKRTIEEDTDELTSEKSGKRFKADSELENKPDTESEAVPDINSEECQTKSEEKSIESNEKPSENNQKPVDLEAGWIKASRGADPPDAVKQTGSGDGPALMNRAEIVKQFWKEQEANSSKKPAPKSPYQSLEPFSAEEECLMQCKLELRKEDGVIRMVLTYLTGSRESMAQVLQYFKNKMATGACEYSGTG